MKEYQEILKAMTLAPSAHNTQPWRFAVRDNNIEVYVDEKRHLTISDPTKRQLYVSLGCALMNGVVAAAHAGKQAVVEYGALHDDAVPAAIIRLQAGPVDQHLASLFPRIAARRTDRSLYDDKSLTKAEQAALSLLASPAIHSCTTLADVDRIAELTAQGTLATLARSDFKGELSRWVRSNWTRKPDGMPGYAMGMPAPLSLVASVLVRVAPIHKQEAPKTEQQMHSASLIAVVVTPTDSPADHIRAGQYLEQLWLEVTAAGLAAAPLAAAIEASEDIRRELQRVLQTDQLPQAILRIGHSKRRNLKATPRRSVEDCVRG
jgi:nitroreductase